MTPRLQAGLWLGGAAAFVLLAAAASWVLLTAGASGEERLVVEGLLERRAPGLVFAGFVLLAALGGIVNWLFRRTVTALRALAEETRIVLGANPGHRVAAAGSPEIAELATAINALGDEFRARGADLEAKIREAGSRLEEERNRLAALMSELSQAVLLCNAEGRILLYNEAAKMIFGAPAGPRSAQQGLVGLGRSVFSLLDRNQVAHALDKIQFSLDAAVAFPVTRFLTMTATGSLARVQLAPFLSAERRVNGMVFLLEDVTELAGQESARRSLLQALATSVRQPAANIRAAAENLVSFLDMDEARRAQFAAIIAEESRVLSSSIDGALSAHADALKAGLSLEDTPVADLINVARRHIESAAAPAGGPAPEPGGESGVEPAGESRGDLGVEPAMATEAVDESLWVKVDSYAVVQMLASLSRRLRDECAIAATSFRAARSDGFVHLDLVWQGGAVPGDALGRWETQPMQPGTGQSTLTVRDVLERHGGEVWRQSDAASQTSWFRFLLPAARPPPPAPSRDARTDSRPEYYDFDLFSGAGVTGPLAEERLAALQYTVFDMETTGLEPSAGDEIISIGAVRIVNGRLLRHEVFDQLVNPRRPISAAAARIHGIRSRDVQEQPVIAEVLPAFHRFCEDTVLVAHNAAFDMRFLELKEAATSVRFAQPVLDTLLLSAVINPSLEDHRLEGIAARLGLTIIGRHTALGDALVTGEVFLKFVPLLAERGILTLRQALEASRETYYARLRY